MADDPGNKDELLSLRITVQNTRRKDVLFAFSTGSSEPITPTEISEVTGMHISNVSRNLRKLRNDRLIRQLESEGTPYCP
jgi:DNA-binding MarR family transcriptional regulator